MTDVPEEYATYQEQTLSRLFNCMKDDEQGKLLKIALQMLGRRCSFDPHYRSLSAESLQAELRNRDLNDRLAGTWPGDWKGRSLVDLDNMGDSYIEGLVENGCELPSDYIAAEDGDEPLDNVAAVEPEFVAFLAAWREGILKTIEKQSRRKAGEEKEPE
jgi:hypothetical protein